MFFLLAESSLIITLYFESKRWLFFQPFFSTILKLCYRKTFGIIENKTVESLNRIIIILNCILCQYSPYRSANLLSFLLFIKMEVGEVLLLHILFSILFNVNTQRLMSLSLFRNHLSRKKKKKR